MSKLKRRDILILLSFWLVGCTMVAVLIGIFYSQRGVEPLQPAPQATDSIVLAFEGESAKAAYIRALPQAQEWNDDVELVAISTYWPEATIETLGRANTWDFRFFSPERRRTYFSLVKPDQPVLGRAHLYKQNSTPTLIDPAEWVIDSDEALLRWINNGGGTFLRTFPGSRVEALLRELPDHQALVWDIIGVSQDQSQLFYLSINANTGDVVN